MKSFFDGLSDTQIIAEYRNTFFKNRGKLFPKSPRPQNQVGVRSDYWSLYLYGNEAKLVYHKCGFINRPDTSQVEKTIKNRSSENDEARFSASLSRSRARVFELAMCNEFTHFCTFTQSPEMRDRFNLADFRKDLAQFVRNQNRGRTDKIKYLLIPERHKDGAWHMHGLLSGLSDNDLRLFTLSEKLPQKMRKQIKNGSKIYNWNSYARRFGFFTCTEIENKNAVSRYITKYITKDMMSKKADSNKHLFFSSQGLKGRETVVHNSFDEPPFTDFDFENDYIAIKTVKF